MTEFKPLETGDLDTIVSLMQDFYALDNYPMTPAVSKKLFLEFLSDENLGKAWLICSDTEIVGYVILTYVFSFEYQGKIAFLDELYLSEKARGKGIGRQTVAFIQRETHKLSLKIIYLEVEHHNEGAQKLYIASGFEFHNRKLMKYKVR